MTEFKEIKDCQRYAISRCGTIINQKTGKFIKQWINTGGYPSISFWDRKKITKVVHRLVAIAFIPNPLQKPQINHIDGIKSNNNVENLEWSTASENSKHAFAIGLQSLAGEKNTQSKLKERDVFDIRKFLANKYLTKKEIEQIYGISSSTISDIHYGRTWSHI